VGTQKAMPARVLPTQNTKIHTYKQLQQETQNRLINHAKRKQQSAARYASAIDNCRMWRGIVLHSKGVLMKKE